MFVTPAALEGISRNRFKYDDKYGAPEGEDPPLVPSLIAGIGNLSSGTPASVDFTFRLVYYVLLTEPNKINRSPLPVVIQPDTTNVPFVQSSQ